MAVSRSRLVAADDAYVHRYGFAAPQPFDAAVLEQPQNLGLEAERHIADFVQKDGAAVGLLDFADPPVGGAGEGAFLIAEKFTLQKGIGNGDAVDYQKRFVVPQTVLVDCAGGQFLAGAGFTPDQHCGLRRGHPADAFVDVLHFRAAADDGLPPAFFRHTVEIHRGAHEFAGGKGLGDQQQHVRNVKRLQDIIVGPYLGGFNGRFRGAVGGHDDYRQFGVHGANPPIGFQAVDARQAHVQYDQVRNRVAQHFQTGLPGGCALNFIAFFHKKFFKAFAKLVVVVNHQYETQNPSPLWAV